MLKLASVDNTAPICLAVGPPCFPYLPKYELIAFLIASTSALWSGEKYTLVSTKSSFLYCSLNLNKNVFKPSPSVPNFLANSTDLTLVLARSANTSPISFTR